MRSRSAAARIRRWWTSCGSGCSAGSTRAGRPSDAVGVVLGAVTVVDRDGDAARRHARREVAMYLDVSRRSIRPSRCRTTCSPRSGCASRTATTRAPAGSCRATCSICSRSRAHRTTSRPRRERLIEAGVDRIEFGTPHGIDSAEGIGLLGREVLPQLRECDAQRSSWARRGSRPIGPEPERIAVEVAQRERRAVRGRAGGARVVPEAGADLERERLAGPAEVAVDLEPGEVGFDEGEVDQHPLRELGRPLAFRPRADSAEPPTRCAVRCRRRCAPSARSVRAAARGALRGRGSARARRRAARRSAPSPRHSRGCGTGAAATGAVRGTRR